jgi:hypothetical protein
MGRPKNDKAKQPRKDREEGLKRILKITHHLVNETVVLARSRRYNIFLEKRIAMQMKHKRLEAKTKKS